MILARTKSVDDTRALAAELAELARPGDILVLAGDLGAGKTAFAQGFAHGLDVHEPVTSPTFQLVRAYQGRLPLVHVDVYRLDHLQEVVDLGLAELLDGPGVVLVEWGDLVEAVLPVDFLEVRLEPGASDDEREVRLRPVGGRRSARTQALRSAVDRWAVA